MKKKFCIAGMILGIILTIYGLSFSLGKSVHYNAETPLDYSFGADYYTEQYAVTRDVALNVARAGNTFENGMNFMITFSGNVTAAMGLIVVCYFGVKLAVAKEAAKKEQEKPSVVIATEAKVEEEKKEESESKEE